MLNRISFLKKCAIGCILGPILASIALLFLRLFLNVAFKFADTSEKKNLKCNLMVLRAVLTSA